jgi:cysteine desulfurase / selenocysteine lyase
MPDRRMVMKAALAYSAWPTLRRFTPSALPEGSAQPSAADESYWAQIRSKFEWEANFANFVTVVRGIAPREIREKACVAMTHLNSQAPAEFLKADWKAEVRRKVAGFINAPVENTALLRNTTEGVTTVLMNWPLKHGDEVLTSSAEHGPFYDTLAQRASRDEVVIKRFHYPAPVTTPQAIVETIERSMTARTKLVLLGQVVLFGQINPVRAIADAVHARGAKLIVDGVLGIGQVPTDVKAMDCDFYAAGFHKFACGPRATAVFYVRPGLIEQLPPLFGSYVLDDQGAFVASYRSGDAAKYESFGTHPEGQFMVLGDSLDFLSTIGVERIQERLFFLTSRWMERAQRLKAFRAAVVLDPAQCAGLVGFELTGKQYRDVRKTLTDHRVLVGGTERYGGFFGIPADTPRSLFCPNVGLCTSRDDVDRLAEALEATAS